MANDSEFGLWLTNDNWKCQDFVHRKNKEEIWLPFAVRVKKGLQQTKNDDDIYLLTDGYAYFSFKATKRENMHHYFFVLSHDIVKKNDLFTFL